MNQLQFHIDVRDQGTEQSVAGYPKYAHSEQRANRMAEEAARELEIANEPGEFIVVVSLEGKDPISSQVIIVKSN